MLKRIFISIAILVAVCLSSFVVYSVAYGSGKTAGYDKGYSAGQDAGYSSGKTDGYNTGYTSGKTDGYNTGYTSGKTDGYQEGMQAGLGHGYTIKDPTYAQALAFIKEDKTDGNKYVDPTYVCTHFSRDVCNNAENKGLRCAFVELRYPDKTGHTIVAFNTTDKGLVYFEPQSDMIARPAIGKRYYQCQDLPPGYSGYLTPAYDDTIEDILVIW
jgi:hypothetical protein